MTVCKQSDWRRQNLGGEHREVCQDPLFRVRWEGLGTNEIMLRHHAVFDIQIEDVDT